MRRALIGLLAIVVLIVPALASAGEPGIADPAAAVLGTEPPTFVRTSPVDPGSPHLLRYNGVASDPALGLPTMPPALRGTIDLYHVQFDGPIQDSDKQLIADAGGELGWYQPANAFVVRIGEQGAQELADAPSVRAVAPYPAGLRLSPDLLGTSGTVEILALSFGSPYKVATAVRELGGQVLRVDATYVEGRLQASSLLSLAYSPEVTW